jgi:hypothetical protein
VRAGVLVLEDLGVVLLAGTSVEDRCSDIRHVLAESSVFVLDLVGKLSSVAEDDDSNLSGDWLDLL